MSEITEIEIKAMTKEQNYMRGYKDGKSDVLDKISAEIKSLDLEWAYAMGTYEGNCADKVQEEVLEIIEKYKGVSE